MFGLLLVYFTTLYWPRALHALAIASSGSKVENFIRVKNVERKDSILS